MKVDKKVPSSDTSRAKANGEGPGRVPGDGGLNSGFINCYSGRLCPEVPSFIHSFAFGSKPATLAEWLLFWGATRSPGTGKMEISQGPGAWSC